MTDAQKHKRVNDILLGPLERPALQWLAAHMPAWMTPDKLTIIGIIGAVIIFASYALSNVHSAFLWLASLGFTFSDDMFVFNASVDGAFVRTESTPYPHLIAKLIIGEGLIPGVTFDASYDKRNIETFEDLFSPEDAVIGATINYKTGPAVITLGYDLRYAPESEEGWETTAKLSTSISIF